MSEPAIRVDGSAAPVTRLRPPALRRGLIPRPRLARDLDRAGGVVLVSAPAGSGKTTMLADWAHHLEHPPAWLSVEPGDNDVARFWRYVVEAVALADADLGRRLRPLLGPPDPPTVNAFVTAVINTLADPDEPAALRLVLDDVHLLGSARVLTSLRFLLEHRPERVQVVLSSRTDPPTPLARLRGRGDLTELRTDDLRFTPAEAARLLHVLADTSGRRLPDATVAALVERTEGWAVGLHLAGLALRDRSDVDGVTAAFTGSHRHVMDYLMSEVLDAQSAGVRDFLLETSVLDRLCGDLCDATTGRSDSQLVLEGLEQANLFLVPLDATRTWWRYQHLFADLLRARSTAERPDRIAGLHRRAADWFGRHGDGAAAVRHALAGDDPARAARLIEQYLEEFSTETATVAGWLAALPADLVRSRPRLLSAQARTTQGRWGTATAPRTEPLTAREQDVLDLLASGRTNRAIADELVLSLDTVKSHVSSVLRKLGATNRTEAVARARALRLIE